MHAPSNIRNVCVVGAIDHGKSTLLEELLRQTANTTQPASLSHDTTKQVHKDMRSRTLVSVVIANGDEDNCNTNNEHQKDDDNNSSCGDDHSVLINFAQVIHDLQGGHEEASAARLCDGAVVVVDVIEGVRVQTETALRLILQQHVRPLLVINKMDQLFSGNFLSSFEEMYDAIVKVVDCVNVCIATYADIAAFGGSCSVTPVDGSVVFCSGLRGWGFTLSQFAHMYAQKMRLTAEEEGKLLKNLWGDRFYHSEAKKWTGTRDGKQTIRGFVKFILQPIQQVYTTCQAEQSTTTATTTTTTATTAAAQETATTPPPAVSALTTLLSSLHVHVSEEEREATGRRGNSVLTHTILKKWLPLQSALFRSVIRYLPSPLAAQPQRAHVLYAGPMDDASAAAIISCNSSGPLVFYVGKMIPTPEKGRFLALGRVFAGTISPGSVVNILGPTAVFGKERDAVSNVTVTDVVVVQGSSFVSVTAVSAGNLCALEGVDAHIAGHATITNDDNTHPLANLHFPSVLTVRTHLTTQNPRDLPKLAEAIRWLSKSDAAVSISMENSGTYSIGCMGELHLEITLKEIREQMKPAELVASEAVVALRETVTTVSSITCATQSANHLNTFACVAEPLTDEIVQTLEGMKEGNSDSTRDQLYKQQRKEGGGKASELWSTIDKRTIWAFGAEGNFTNSLVDGTRDLDSTPHLLESRAPILSGFNWATKEGVLAEEELRGVQFRIVDATLHSQTCHRGGGQLVPCVRRAFNAAQLSAEPRLMEPIYLVNIIAPINAYTGVYAAVAQYGGEIVEERAKEGTPLSHIFAHLPVLQSRGFASCLRERTAGQAFPQMTVDHWALVPDSPMDVGTRAHQLVMDVRRRKGLPLELPTLDQLGLVPYTTTTKNNNNDNNNNNNND